ncbi:MAG: hypothetical protein NC247_01930 [Ruminococcus flavefaciens]|nr:hypothetical protein [Ruminococcus flavefaciens]
MSNIDLIQDKLPRFYRKYPIKGENERSNMYPVLIAFSKLLDESMDIVDRIDGMMGINTTHNDDLYHRWGSILGITKGNGSWELFRNKIKLAMLSGVGGTKQAIKFAVAIIASIEDNAELQDKYIQVIDAWEYEGKLVPNEFDPHYDPVLNDEMFTLNDSFKLNNEYDPHKYGGFVVVMDLAANEMILTPDNGIVWDTINTVKAAGTNGYLVYVYTTDDGANIHGDYDVVDKLIDIFSDKGRLIGYNLPYYPNLNDELYNHGLNDDFVLNDRLYQYDHMADDYLFDIIKQKLSESGSITSEKSRVWYDNAGKLNYDMILNRWLDTDDIKDIIRAIYSELGRFKANDYETYRLTDNHHNEYGYFANTNGGTFNPTLNNDRGILNDSFILGEFVATSEPDEIIDKLIDKTYSDGASIYSDKTLYWFDDIGTTNGSMILNKYRDTDDTHDIVSYIGGGTIKAVERMSSCIKEISDDHTHIASTNPVFMPSLNCDESTLNNDLELSVTSKLGSDDNLMEKAIQTIKDTGALLSYELKAWSRDGMNSYDILNTSFITNMREETDKCVDIITYQGGRSND